MADNELTVIRADGNTRTLRSFDLGSSIHAQGALVELPEECPALTGGTVRYSVDASPVVALDPPTAGAHYARVRVWHSASGAFRLFYRTDGTDPTADGANAMGFLLHGEAIQVRAKDPTLFEMIGETAMTGTFEVFVEWVKVAAS